MAESDQIRSPTTPAERKRAFRILFISLTCLGMGQTVIFAVLPPVARTLGYSEFQVGAIFMVSAVFWVIMSPFWGRRSDFWGRKRVILAGLSAFAVSTLLFGGLLWVALGGLAAASLVYPALILSRVIYGAIGPGAMSAANAYVADRTTRQERTVGLATIGAAFGLGTTFGPSLASLLSFAGLVVPILVVGGLAALSVLLIWVYLPERTPPKQQAEQPVVKLWDPRIRLHLVYSTLTSSAHAVPIQMVGFFVIDVLSYTPAQAISVAGIGLTALSVSGLVTQLLVIPRLGLSTAQLMTVGLWLSVIAFALFVSILSVTAMVLAMTVMGIAGCFARVGVMGAASLSVGRDEQGAIAGLMSATGGGGFVLGPAIGFLLYQYSPVAPFWMTAGVLILLGLFILRSPFAAVESEVPKP